MTFPELFSITINKEAWLDQLWEQAGETGCWNPIFTRQINDWELGEVKGLLRRLQGHVISGGVADVIVWWLSKGSIFFVKSFYSSLVGCYPKGFPASLVWNPWVPMKIGFFAWEVVWEKNSNFGSAKKEGLESSK